VTPVDCIDLACEVVVDEPHLRAILVDFGDKEVWVPRSIIKSEIEDDEVVIVIPEWFAKQEGLI